MGRQEARVPHRRPRPICAEAITPGCAAHAEFPGSLGSVLVSRWLYKSRGGGDPGEGTERLPDGGLRSAGLPSVSRRARRAERARSSCWRRARIDSAATRAPGGRAEESRSRPPREPGAPVVAPCRGARPPQRPRWPRAGRPGGVRSASAGAAFTSLPARRSVDSFSCPRPAGDGRGLSPLPPAAPRGPGSEPQGLKSRVPGSGTRAGCCRRRSGEPLASLSPGPRGGRGGTRHGFSCAACLARPARPAVSWELEGRGRARLCPRPAWSWTGAVWYGEPG